MAGTDEAKRRPQAPSGGTEAMPNTPLPDDPGTATGAEGNGSGLQRGGTLPGGGPGAGLGSIGTGGGCSGGAAGGTAKRGGR